MSDLNAELTAAVSQALRADDRVQAIFGGADKVRVFDVVPDDQPFPYVQLPGGPVDPVEADGGDISTIAFPVHFWSRPAQPGYEEARAFAQAARDILPGVQIASGGVIYFATAPSTTAPLPDPSDPRIVHIVITVTFTSASA